MRFLVAGVTPMVVTAPLVSTAATGVLRSTALAVRGTTTSTTASCTGSSTLSQTVVLAAAYRTNFFQFLLKKYGMIKNT